MVGANVISGKIAKDVLDIVWSEGGDPRALVAAQMPQADKAARSHAVVDNSGAQRALDAVADGLATNMLRGLWWS